jgi:hypothetical protein
MLIMLAIVQFMFAVVTLPVINRYIEEHDVGEALGASVAFLAFAMSAYYLLMEGME